MVKTKTGPKTDAIRTISTSAIFKHIKPRQWKKKDTFQTPDTIQKSIRAVEKSSKHRNERLPDHPLAIALSGSLP